MKEIEDILMNSNSENTSVPVKFTNSINMALNKDKVGWRFNMKRRIGIVLVSLLLITSFVYAGYKFQDIFNFDKAGINDKGIQTAVENQYIQNIDMDYISKDDLEFKVDYLLMDDINFDLVFNFKTKDDISNYQGIFLNNLLITDEQGNHIYMETEGAEHFNSYALLEGTNTIEKKGNIMRQVLFAYSDQFPKSKKIYVSFDGITLYRVENGNADTKNIEGDWKLEFDVSKQLSDRKEIQYKTGNNKISETKLTNSGLIITMNSELSNEKLKLIDDNKNEYNVVQTLTLVDREKGEYTTDKRAVIFDMTLYNQTNNIKLISNTGETINLLKE